jgi:protein tyrosine phosphatase (PTP) superfamily phosphohydrolase (DUF442 family)
MTPNSEDIFQESPPAASASETVRQAAAEAELSGGGMRRASAVRWLLMGGVRVLYRAWTRVAARVFPAGSAQARAAAAVGVPLPDRLNMSWITPQLAVGGRVHPDDIARLAAIGVTRVVDTRAEYHDDEAALAAHGIQLLYLPTPDTEPLTLDQLAEGARWIDTQITAGERVLVHCEHGVGRSAMLAAAALVAGGMNAHDAMRLVQASRWQAAPNHRQIVRLQEFERAVRTGALP